jgi:uracil-DNA glycosylase
MNIFKEQQKDLHTPYPQSGNLERWSDQGVLMLNAVLTVEQGKAGSHQKKGWERFTDTVIQTLSNERENLVFMLWGGFAKGKLKLINEKKHFVLTSGHPSPLSANRGYWFGNHHFSRANRYLQERSKKQIQW